VCIVARLRTGDASSVRRISCGFIIRGACQCLIRLVHDVDAAFLDVQMKFIDARITQDIVMAG